MNQTGEPKCECPSAGFCSRYQIEQTERAWQLCSGNCPADNPCSPYLSLKYREKWARQRDGAASTPLPLRGRATSHGPAEAREPAAPKPPPVGFGPGTELSAMLKELGFKPCELCRELAERMDHWGVEGCRLPENEAVILARLREKHRDASRLERVKAAALAAWGGLALKIDWGDPAPGLLAEAIRRAGAKAQAATPTP